MLDMSEESELTNERTILDWLCDCVNFPVDENAAKDILLCRNVSEDSSIADVESKEKELCKADLYVWLCTSPTRKGDSSDSDNSWSHKEGGFTISDTDKKRLMSLANEIYVKYDEPKVGASRIKIHGIGIKKRMKFV